jgi:integrase-like protein
MESVPSSHTASSAPSQPVPAAGAPKLLDRVRQMIRAKHYSRRTESAYVEWIRRYILFHRERHPCEMGASEIAAFLTWLATDRRVSASTQNQGALRIGPPRTLFQGLFRTGPFWAEYDVNSKTREFLMLAVDEPLQPRLTIAVNWTNSLNQR